MNHAPTSSFGTYEALRILVPGFYFTTLLMFFYGCFLSQYAPMNLSGIPLLALFLFVVLVSGLTMYAKETTKRRKAFTENLPSAYLQNKARVLSDAEPLSDEDSRRLYFYILNNHTPPTFHEKVFFFGTIYRVMIHIRRTSFWFAIASVFALAVQLANGVSFVQQKEIVAFSLVVWLVYLLNVRYNKADRKMQENYQDQIFWLEMNDDIVKEEMRKRRAFQKHAK